AWQALAKTLQTPSSPWWDLTVPGQSPTHDPAALAGSAIDAAAADLQQSLGDPASWTWGALHTVTFKEGTLGSSGILPLELYFNPSARRVAGADGAIDNNYYQVSRAYPNPDDPGQAPLGLGQVFSVTNGPSLRFVVYMSALHAAPICA